ncbi:acyl-CoA thioesterase-2 [Thermasporomyces composti]|uniref:Acyl-CoA thioesterase 2 n=1 Tax=Thermasporomyces composti TaxID=696763 RepID=A0A3D9V8Q0_THECX|nr:acyl-CoA thioesterase-2 [Thermasporomyces composti]
MAVPRSLDELLDLLDLERIDDNLFRGRQPETRLQRVFGGQVAGQALVAAARTMEPGRTVHSLHAYFLRPGDTSVPIVYDVECTREGRSFSTRRVVARQHGETIFFMAASFHVAESGFDHQDVAPDVPPPESCPTLGEVMEKVSGRPSDDWAEEWSALEVRYVGDSRRGGVPRDGEHPARARVWFRAAGTLPDDPVLHSCVLAYASDLTLLGVTLVPHDTYIGAPKLQTASIDHAIWFHRPVRVDDWLLYDQHSPSAANSLGLATGRIFAGGRRLVASVAQEGLIRGPRDTAR